MAAKHLANVFEQGTGPRGRDVQAWVRIEARPGTSLKVTEFDRCEVDGMSVDLSELQLGFSFPLRVDVPEQPPARWMLRLRSQGERGPAGACGTLELQVRYAEADEDPRFERWPETASAAAPLALPGPLAWSLWLGGGTLLAWLFSAGC